MHGDSPNSTVLTCPELHFGMQTTTKLRVFAVQGKYSLNYVYSVASSGAVGVSSRESIQPFELFGGHFGVIIL